MTPAWESLRAGCPRWWMWTSRPGHSRRRKRHRPINEAGIGAVGLLVEKSRLGQRIQDLGAGVLVHCPQTLRLKAAQPQTRHLEVFAADPTQELFP